MRKDKFPYNLTLLFFVSMYAFKIVKAELNNSNKILCSFFSELYQFRFEDAKKKLANPESKLINIEKLNYYWWMLVTTGEKSYLSHCFANIILYEHSASNDDTLQIIYEAFKLRLLLYNKQYLKAYKNSNLLFDKIIKFYEANNSSIFSLFFVGY